MQSPLPTMVLLPLGTLLQNGTYRLEQLTKHRGWQLTYEGTHLPSQQSVLIETLNPSRQRNNISQQCDAFLQRAQAWHRLKHPCLEPFRDVFVESVLPFLVKDKLSGQTWAMQAKKQPLSEAEAIAQITQIANGLHSAHQQQLLHGDIQPKNITIHPQAQHPVLMNWVWKLSIPTALHAYAAPEMIQGRPTVATDIYGLAATLYTLVTGEMPIPASKRQDIRLEIHHPGLSQATIVALLRGMAMHPRHRPQSIPDWMKLLPTPSSPAVSFPAESGNIGAASPSLTTEQPSSPVGTSIQKTSSSTEPKSSAQEVSAQEGSAVSSELQFAHELEEMSVPTFTESTVSLQEPSKTVSPTRIQPYSAPPRFPFRALIICSILSGVVGIAFGLLLRFHYQNQFTNPQVPAKAPPIQNEDFLPKPGSTTGLETLPEPTETPIESPTPTPLEDPSVDPPLESVDPPLIQGGIESDPSLQETPPLSPDPFAPSPALDPPLEPYPETFPDSLESEAASPPFDPFSTPDFSTPPSDTSEDF